MPASAVGLPPCLDQVIRVSRKKTSPSFEEALSELELLVSTLEKGELNLEESLVAFERGVALSRICQQSLQEAEQKVRVLSGEGSHAELVEFPDAGIRAGD